MQLHGVAELLGEKELETGMYTQIRFAVVKADLELEDGTTAEVTVPSSKIKVVRPFTIDEDSLTELIIDFNPDSVKKAGDKYIMTPVLKLMTPVEFQEHKKNIEEEQEEETEEEIDEDAPALSPEDVIEEFGGTARFVASITDGPLQVILFQGNDGNFIPPGQQDGNNGNGNNSQGNQPETVDLNKMTVLNITIGELSIHLSKSFVKIPDVNVSDDGNEMDPPDGNDSNDENTNEDVNANLGAHEDNNNNSKKQNKWILISDEEQTFDLLQLETTEALLADSEIPAGKYTQIRMQIVSATAVIDGNEFEVRVPPNKLMLHGVFDAVEGSITFMSLDFDVEKSVHVTGNNKIILRPTIKLTIIVDADVTIDNGEVEVENGETVEESEQEFDEDGN